jgi:hypothetical protein
MSGGIPGDQIVIEQLEGTFSGTEHEHEHDHDHDQDTHDLILLVNELVPADSKLASIFDIGRLVEDLQIKRFDSATRAIEEYFDAHDTFSREANTDTTITIRSRLVSLELRILEK